MSFTVPPPPRAHSFIIGPAVINTHTHLSLLRSPKSKGPRAREREREREIRNYPLMITGSLRLGRRPRTDSASPRYGLPDRVTAYM